MLTKNRIDKLITKMEPDGETKERRAYRAVLTAMNGPWIDDDHAVKTISEFWNDLSPAFIDMIYRLIDQKVFTVGTKKNKPFLAKDIYGDGDMGIILGATIALGYLERAK